MKYYTKNVVTTFSFLFIFAFLFNADAKAQTANGDVWESASRLTLITFFKDGKVKFEDDDDGDGEFSDENGTFKTKGNSIEMDFVGKTIRAVITKDGMRCVLYYKGTADTYTFELKKY